MIKKINQAVSSIRHKKIGNHWSVPKKLYITQLDFLDATNNGTVRFKKCKQLLKYQHLLRDICWTKLKSIFNFVHFF